LDVPERRLLRDGAQVPLRLKALKHLCAGGERRALVTKETLLKQVWSDAVVEENNINANVSILRKALGRMQMASPTSKLCRVWDTVSSQRPER
jgi:DNA-binding winged helix-turn-helix (wHTH) protein